MTSSTSSPISPRRRSTRTRRAALMRSWRSLHRFMAILMVLSVTVHIGGGLVLRFPLDLRKMIAARWRGAGCGSCDGSPPSSCSSVSRSSRRTARAQLLSPGRCRRRTRASRETSTAATATRPASASSNELCTNKCHSDLGARIAAGAGPPRQGVQGPALREVPRRAPRHQPAHRPVARRQPASIRSRAGGLAAPERAQGRGLREVPHASRTRAARRRTSVSRRRARPATRTRTPDASGTPARRATTT